MMLFAYKTINFAYYLFKNLIIASSAICVIKYIKETGSKKKYKNIKKI